MSHHHCWSDGWSRDLDDDHCVTSCSDPNEYYYGINWNVNCVHGCTKLPNGRYPNDVSANGECLDDCDSSDTVEIRCDISGQWLVTNDMFCDCSDVEENYDEFPCLDWRCSPKEVLKKCKSICPTNNKTFSVTCDFDGEWRRARNKEVHCDCGERFD